MRSALHRGWATSVAGVLGVLWATACGAPDVGPGDPDQGRPRALPHASSAPAPPPRLELPEVASDPREPALAATITKLLTERHLERRPLDDELSRAAFATYLWSLDPAKLYLLAPHVAALESYALDIDDQMRSGDLRLARLGAGALAARRRVVAQMVAELLRQPLDLDDEELIETDGDALAFCGDEAQLRDRWRQLLELQVLQRIAETDPRALEATPDRFASVERAAREEIAQNLAARFARLSHVDPLEPAERLFNAVVSTYDGHSRYLAPAARAELESALTGASESVGVNLAERGPVLVVQSLEAGGAAYARGEPEVGDVVLSVAEAGQPPVPLADLPLARAQAMLLGAAGTKVTLRVQKLDGRVADVHLTRSVIAREASYARSAELRLTSAAAPAGYVHLPSFYDQGGAVDSHASRSATTDVREFLEGFQRRQLAGCVLDLRGNQGGLLTHAEHIAGLLIKKGPIAQTRDASGSLATLTDIHPFATFDGAVVVLVDRFTASASEVLAGVLQDYRRAVVVGTGATYGKGTVQDLIDLDRERFGAAPPDGQPLGLLALTTRQYYRVDGASTQARGVVPDVVVPDPASHLHVGERFVEHAIAFGRIAPVLFTAETPAWDPVVIAARSAQRVAADPVLAKVTERGALLAGASTQVPLGRAAWRAARVRDAQALDAVEGALERAPKQLSVERSAPAAPKAWLDSIARDPWLAEAVRVLEDMVASRPRAPHP